MSRMKTREMSHRREETTKLLELVLNSSMIIHAVLFQRLADAMMLLLEIFLIIKHASTDSILLLRIE
jgi:hypothetical protein